MAPKSRKSPAATAASSSQRGLRNRSITDMFNNQKAASTRKKFRQVDESSNEEEEEEEDELNSSDSDSDQETTTSGRKKKTTSTANRRRQSANNVVLSTNSQLLEPITQDSPETQDSLYEKAMVPENDMEKVVEKWVKKYSSDKTSALRDLVNFVIRAAGCSMAITSDALNQTDGSIDALKELQDELAKLPHTEYPIISRQKEYKSLRRNLLLFFQELIEQCQHEIMYDGILIETLQNWLTTISSSLYRPFRHTATLVGLRIIHALCVVGDTLRDELKTAKRQLSNESKKRDNTRNRDADRARRLKQSCTTLERKCKDLEEFLTEFFSSIFVHRTRDVESVIRAECIRELGNWMIAYRAFFVDNSYMRFLGWSFNDPNASVRSETIKTLSKLYKVEEIASKLDTFTGRFKSRIEEMALYDIDVSVRVNAIHLCGALFKLKINVLSEKGRSELSNMIASDVPRVRKSAAPFVKALIETNIIDPLVTEVTQVLSKGKGGRRNATAATSAADVNKTWVTFKAISSFLVEQTTNIIEKETEDDMEVDLETVSSHLTEKRNFVITNIVEALWDQVPELQDYRSMSGYLCRDHSQTQQQRQHDEDDMDSESTTIEDCYRLTEDEETVLANVFVACIRTAMTKGLDKNLDDGKKKMDAEVLDETKNELSRHLVTILPKLLSKYTDDVNRMTQLIFVPTLMNMNVYMELRAENEYEELLQTLVRVYAGAVLTDVLTNCASSLQHMAKNTALSELNNLHLSELRDTVVNQVRQACSGKDLVTARYTAALIHSISVSMLRLACLINFTNATEAMEDSQGMTMNVVEYVGALTDRATFGNEKEQSIGQSAMSVLSRYIMWKCNDLTAGTATPSQSDVALVERRRDWVLDKFTELVKGTDVSPCPEIRAAAFGYLVDLYWMFTSDLFDTNGLDRLKVRCSINLQAECANYIKENMASTITNTANLALQVPEAPTMPAKSTPETTKTYQIALKKYQAKLKKHEEDTKSLDDQKDQLYTIVTSYARGLIMGVFDIADSKFLLTNYGTAALGLDEIISSLVTELQVDLISGDAAADGICRVYLDSLKESFNNHVADSGRSIEKTLKLARVEASSLKRADEQDTVRKVPPQVVCERIHLDGISFAFAKAAEAYDENRDDARDNALKFFKVLVIFGKYLTRARDVAKIYNYLEDCLQQYGMEVDQAAKEWEPYMSYVKTIDQVLKKKGLRYDPTKRANNAETPAAHMFNDVELPEIDEFEGALGSKRTLAETDMDVDEEDATPKKRRD